MASGCGTGAPAKEEAKPESQENVSKPVESKGPAENSASASSRPPLPKGETTAVTVSHQGTPYHYNVFAPRSLKEGMPVMVVINTSPIGDAEPLSKNMAEKLGWLMVGLVEARNGPGEPVYYNMISTVEDLAYRYNIHPRGLIFSGFSGGSRSSFFFAKRFGDMCSGIVAIGAASSGTPGVLAPDIPVFYITGETDFNRPEVEREFARESKAGRIVKMAKHPGGHSWGTAELQEQALEWLSQNLPAVASAPAR